MKPIHRIVLQMREHEKTYAEICQETGLAKSTISYILKKHFPGVRNQKIKEKKMRELYRSDSFKEAQIRRNAAARRVYTNQHVKLRDAYLKKLQGFSDQSFIYYISGLYEGEGIHSGTEFSFCNSDPKLVSAFLLFLRKVLFLPEDRFTLRFSTHSSFTKEEHDESYFMWQEICDHRIDYVSRYDTRPQKKVYKHHANRRYHGTLTVRVTSPNGIKSALATYTY